MSPSADTDRPGAATDGDVAAGVDEAGAGDRKRLRDPVDRVSLPDAAEVEARARLELDRKAVDAHGAAARGTAHPAGGCLGGHLLERPVVAGGDERVVDGGVEAAAGGLAGCERQFDDAHEVRARLPDVTVAIQARQLRIGAEARQHLLQALELRLGAVERTLRALAGRCIQQELHVGAHRVEGAAQHQELLVTVSGGRLTIRTDAAVAGAAAAWSDRACACAICARRCFRATW